MRPSTGNRRSRGCDINTFHSRKRLTTPQTALTPGTPRAGRKRPKSRPPDPVLSFPPPCLGFGTSSKPWRPPLYPRISIGTSHSRKHLATPQNRPNSRYIWGRGGVRLTQDPLITPQFFTVFRECRAPQARKKFDRCAGHSPHLTTFLIRCARAQFDHFLIRGRNLTNYPTMYGTHTAVSYPVRFIHQPYRYSC